MIKTIIVIIIHILLLLLLLLSYKLTAAFAFCNGEVSLK